MYHTQTFIIDAMLLFLTCCGHDDTYRSKWAAGLAGAVDVPAKRASCCVIWVAYLRVCFISLTEKITYLTRNLLLSIF